MKISPRLEKQQVVFALFSLLVLAFGLSLFLSLYKQASGFNIRSHSFCYSLSLLFLSLIIWLALVILWQALVRIENRYAQIDLRAFLCEGLLPFAPLGLSFLSPFLLKHYLTADDLRSRLNLLGTAMAVGFLSLKLFQLRRRFQEKKFGERLLARFSSLATAKKLLILFLIAFAIYQLCALMLVSRGISFSGDEPYYLLTAHSLYQDRDINLANNYQNRDYFHFYPRELFPKLRLGAYARFGRKGTDYVYPINQPGLSLLIQPFYWLSRLFQGQERIFILKTGLSIWAVLLGLQVFLLVRESTGNEKVSLIIWALYSFTSPLLFYAIHLYPEVPIALFSVYIFRKVRSDKPLSIFGYFFLGFLLSLFLWFGLKYNLIFWPLLLVCVYFLLKTHRAGSKVLAFLAFPLLSLGLFYLYIYELYGTFYPIAIYEGVLTPEKIREFKETALSIPLRLRVDTFLDYFLDQRDGLLFYSPLYFFSFLGLAEVFRRSKRDLGLLLLLALPYLLNYAFFSHRQGHCPQGRVLTSISWIGAVLIGYFLAFNRKKFYSSLFWFSALVSLVFAAILLQHPSFLYQPTTHEFTFRGGDLFIFLSNLYFYLPGLLPSFIKVDNTGYLPNYVWLALILVLAAGYLRKKSLFKNSRFFSAPLLTSAGLLLFFWWFILYPRQVLLFPVRADYSAGKRLAFYDLGRSVKTRGPGQFRIFKDNFASALHFTSWREIKSLEISFGSLEGEYRVEVGLFDERLFKGLTSKEIKTIEVVSPPRYRLKNINLYRLRIKIENLTESLTAENPYSLSIRPFY